MSRTRRSPARVPARSAHALRNPAEPFDGERRRSLLARRNGRGSHHSTGRSRSARERERQHGSGEVVPSSFPQRSAFAMQASFESKTDLKKRGGHMFGFGFGTGSTLRCRSWMWNPAPGSSARGQFHRLADGCFWPTQEAWPPRPKAAVLSSRNGHALAPGEPDLSMSHWAPSMTLRGQHARRSAKRRASTSGAKPSGRPTPLSRAGKLNSSSACIFWSELVSGSGRK